MQQWTIKHDKVYSLGEVDYLGVPYEAILRGEVGTLPDDYDGWFPFLKMWHSRRCSAKAWHQSTNTSLQNGQATRKPCWHVALRIGGLTDD